MFEDLIATRKKTGGLKRWLFFSVSLAFHVCLIGSLLAASLWAVQEVPEPENSAPSGPEIVKVAASRLVETVMEPPACA